MEVTGKKLLLAVSGGADSVCLLHLFHKLQRELHLELICVHVNHGLRESAVIDEAFVKVMAEVRGIPFYSTVVDVKGYAAKNKMTIEEAGRTLRYAYFEEVRRETGADYVVLAHHKDDCAETFLFHLCRGSGVRGLGGIRPVAGTLLRPLLFARREEIETYLASKGIAFMTDETNLSTEYSRNRIRHQLMPVAESICKDAGSHIAETARELQQVEDYLAGQTQEAYASLVCDMNEGRLIREEGFFSLHPVIAGRVIYRVIADLAGSAKDIGRVHVAAVKEVFAMQTGHFAELPYGLVARRTYEGVLVGKKSVLGKRQGGGQTEAVLEEEIFLQGLGMVLGKEDSSAHFQNIPEKTYTKWFDYDKIRCCPIFRTRKTGDYLVIDDAGRRKTLKQYMVDEKIPSYRRDQMWILADGNHVMWIPGYRISAAYKVKPETERIVRWSVNPETDSRE